jgi:uncharacterized protein DUF3352
VLAVSSFGLGVLAAPASGPTDQAARFVPANALVYVHAWTARSEDRRLFALAQRFAVVRALRERAARALGGVDVGPWLGNEAALALLPGAQPQPLLVAAVRDRRRADAALGPATGSYRGIPIRRLGTAAAAFSGNFILIGPEPAIRAALGRGPRLPDAPSYRRATENGPSGRTLDAYASPAGIDQVLGSSRLTDLPGLKAVGATLTAADGGARITLRAVGATLKTGEFESRLVDRVPAGAAAYVAVAGGAELRALAERAGAGPLLAMARQALAREAGVNLDRDLLAPLRGELGLAAWTRAGAPVATLLARTSAAGRTREALARLQPPVATRFGADTFEPRRIGGLDAFVLPATPLLEPAYAVTRGTLIASTHSSALARARTSLATTPAFRRAFGEKRPKVEALVFFDLRQLLALGELTGALAPGLSGDLADLRLVRSVGAVVRREKTDTTAELFLETP